MASIYLFICDKKCKYIGCTTRSLSARFNELKYQAKTRKTGVSYCFSNEHENRRILLLETCAAEKRFEKEIYWIKKFGKSNLLNIANGGRGPTGWTQSKKHREISRRVMQKRWATKRDDMLQKVNGHKTKEFQSHAGKLGAFAKWSKWKAGGLSQ